MLGDIPNTPRTHGIALIEKTGHGFITNAGDSTVTMFDFKPLAVIRKITIAAGGLDGIMHDEPDAHIVLTNHSKPAGTVITVDPKAGDVLGQAELEDDGPEGAAANGRGQIFVNNEGTSTIQAVDEKSMKAIASWPRSPCEGPTGIACDKASNRIFAGCGKSSVVVDGTSGKVVATIASADDARCEDHRRRPARGPIIATRFFAITH